MYINYYLNVLTIECYYFDRGYIKTPFDISKCYVSLTSHMYLEPID